MPLIVLHTSINAPVERCFDLARSIDLHMLSTGKSQEKAIAGRTTGLIELNETVTWQARHFGITQHLSSRITEMKRPEYFVDEMVKGAFKSIFHQHFFEAQDKSALMTDKFQYEVPFGILGRLFNALILHRYMKRLLVERNKVIKTIAESEKWKEYIPHSKV